MEKRIRDDEIRSLLDQADELLPQLIQLAHELRTLVRRAYYLQSRVGADHPSSGRFEGLPAPPAPGSTLRMR